MDDDNRFVKYRRADIIAIRHLEESFMHDAAYGLLFRAGQTVGSRIARLARPYKQQYFEAARRILVDEGWIKDIQFQNDTITAQSSIEADKAAQKATCHMLRGVIAKVYEGYFGKLMTCTESECESAGNPKCVFKVNFANNVEKNKKNNGQQAAGSGQ
jgi:predicted hydrocarbon binding protein